jgi:hypothetical protein
MKTHLDKILRECVDLAHRDARLGRTGNVWDRGAVLVEILADFESDGVAMRYLDDKGRIAWKATPLLTDHLDDLRFDAEIDFEQEMI